VPEKRKNQHKDNLNSKEAHFAGKPCGSNPQKIGFHQGNQRGKWETFRGSPRRGPGSSVREKRMDFNPERDCKGE